MTICWFGIYNPDFSRNKIYMRGLRANGVTILPCRSSAPGLLKYWQLWKQHRALPAYDAMVVGYPGHLVVPFAKLLSKKLVVADLLGSLSDAELYSHAPSPWRLFKSRIIDEFALRCADIVLLESEAQKRYFEMRFGVSSKYKVLYTGADDTVFHCDVRAEKKRFMVLFRGRLTPECGIMHILKVAELLKEKDGIQFRIVGAGPLLTEVRSFVSKHALANVELIMEYLVDDTLRGKMCDANLALGQFENNQRLSRTIPHKAFEAFAMGIPYLSGNGAAVSEVVKDGKTGFLVPLADPNMLATRIEELSQDRTLCAQVAVEGHRMFRRFFSPEVLAAQLVQSLNL